MALVWVSARKTYRDTDTGDLLSQDDLVELRNAYAVAKGTDVDALASDFLDGTTAEAAFNALFQDLIVDMMTTGYTFGRGGVDQMTDADWDALAIAIDAQIEYANGFGADIAAGDMSPDQIRARANLYTGTSVRTYEQGHAAAVGPTMPTYPGDTVCKGRCRCTWIIVDMGDRWECTWKMEPGANHCSTCLGNSRLYSPYVVMKGAQV